MRGFLCFWIGLTVSFPLYADAVRWSLQTDEDHLTLTVSIPESQYLYAAETAPELEPAAVAERMPETKSYKDSLSGETIQIYPGPGTHQWCYTLKSLSFPLTVKCRWQGCRSASGTASAMCMMPENKILGTFPSLEELKRNMGGVVEPVIPENVPSLKDFQILRSAEGYLSASEFRKFLTDNGIRHSGFSFSGRGILMTILLALFGGLALNLTPCVLPLIPVNLAVIGAGNDSQYGKRTRILRGVIYGSGIALTYGLLGIFAVLTGSAFGGIDSSWLFNGIAGIIFLFLGLAMFDFFQLDLSRFSAKMRMPSGAKLAGVFILGSVSALLAGACVAPVLAAALVQASALAAKQNYAGLFLPFLLGIGMALPWPFAAAGLALFPKPGNWMVRVKQILGILILLLAGYYFWISGSLWFSDRNANVPSDGTAMIRTINDALTESGKTGKPVLLDFWATWCKSCQAMERTTFRDPKVKEALHSVIFVKIQAENLRDPKTAGLLKRFSVTGLPSCVLLKAK